MSRSLSQRLIGLATLLIATGILLLPTIGSTSSKKVAERPSGELMNEENLRTEYDTLMNWRISKLQRQDQWGSILIPTAFALYGAGVYAFFSSSPPRWSWLILWLAWIGAFGLLFLWRWNDYIVDETIRVSAYPRMVQIEEQLEMYAVREFVRRAFWPDRKDWPSRQEIEKLNSDYKVSYGTVRSNITRSICTSKKSTPTDTRSLFKWDHVAAMLIAGSFIANLFFMLLKIIGSCVSASGSTDQL